MVYPEARKPRNVDTMNVEEMSEPKLGSAIPQLPTGDIEKTAAYFTERLGFEIAGTFAQHNFLIVKKRAGRDPRLADPF